MINQDKLTELAKLIDNAKTVLILQADNPDGDSLASALALENMLGDMGKHTILSCAVDMPNHLRYLSGWDRVEKDLPAQFDISIIVDCSSETLFELYKNAGQLGWLGTKPSIVVDHHNDSSGLSFGNLVINEPAVATGEILYDIATGLNWPLNDEAKRLIAISILSDSLGLTTDATTPHSIRIIADLVEGGVSIPALETARRDLMRREPELVHYKGELLKRVEYFSDNRIAIVSIPWSEIEKYSSQYNPSILVLDDMRLTIGTTIAIAFKMYKDGKVTAKIRTNYGYNIAGELAAAFGGGGHPYASGFKITDGRSYSEIKSEVIQKATEMLDNLNS